MNMTREQRSQRDRMAPKCKAGCGNVARLNEDYCGAHMPCTVIRYETEAMASLRKLVTDTSSCLSDEDFDTFKTVLTHLEHCGFKLRGPQL